VLLAVLPGHIYFSTLVMTETVFTMLFMLFFYLVCIWTLERRAASALVLVALGALLGYAALVRSEAIFLAPAVMLLWFVRLPRWRIPIRYALMFAAGVTSSSASDRPQRAAARRVDPAAHRQTERLNVFDRHYLTGPIVFPVLRPPDDTLGYIARHPWRSSRSKSISCQSHRNDHEGIDWVTRGAADRGERSSAVARDRRPPTRWQWPPSSCQRSSGCRFAFPRASHSLRVALDRHPTDVLPEPATTSQCCLSCASSRRQA
jgi:hypothetical protein